jgi:DNA/RNA endonuclease YhcR with UshA esterase domain
VDVVGIIGQFRDDYQITPRSETDLVLHKKESCAPPKDVSISDAKKEEAGTLVTVRGRVSSTIDWRTDGKANFAIQNADGGIFVFSESEYDYTVNEGDSVVITGIVEERAQEDGEFAEGSGYMRISGVSKIEKIGETNVKVEPKKLTAALREEDEGRLVILTHAIIQDTTGWRERGDFNITVEQGGVTYRVRIQTFPITPSNLSPAPTIGDTIEIIGIASQWEGSRRIMLRSEEDWKVSTGPAPTNLKEANLTGVSIFPNPATGTVNIQMEALNGQAQISLFDLSGKVLRTAQITEAFSTLQINELNAGMYIIRVQSAEGQFSQPLMVK